MFAGLPCAFVEDVEFRAEGSLELCNGPAAEIRRDRFDAEVDGVSVVVLRARRPVGTRPTLFRVSVIPIVDGRDDEDRLPRVPPDMLSRLDRQHDLGRERREFDPGFDLDHTDSSTMGR